LAAFEVTPEAVGLVWANTILFALAILATGIIPLDLLLWLLLLAFAIWFTKKSKTAKPAFAPEQVEVGNH
jgi:hypothetical protein